MKENKFNVELIEIFSVLKKRWLFLSILVSITGILSGYFNYYVTPPMYESFATLMVNFKEDQQSITTYNDLVMSQKLVSTYAEIIKSRSIAQQVIETMNLDIEPSVLVSNISVESLNDTELIKVTVKNHDPVVAANIANTLSTTFQKYIKQMMYIENVVIIDSAIVDDHIISPNRLFNVIACSGISFIVGVIIVFVLESLKRTFKTLDDLDLYLDLPIIGVVADSESLS